MTQQIFQWRWEGVESNLSEGRPAKLGENWRKAPNIRNGDPEEFGHLVQILEFRPNNEITIRGRLDGNP
jgi:hypothetical protein